MPDQRSDLVAVGLCQFWVYPDGRRGRIAFHLRLKLDPAGIQRDHLVLHLIGGHACDDGIDQLCMVCLCLRQLLFQRTTVLRCCRLQAVALLGVFLAKYLQGIFIHQVVLQSFEDKLLQFDL
ncbi:hypothetical protein [Oceaniglobus trochenteri]|uniref:hypothetical protein n=1 Tax=Oceaniglobus trochenteri TaxID=2763260 RepID=UPI001CFFD128|nr:hypothetical protein [Oceaniglobus trochenteri]